MSNDRNTVEKVNGFVNSLFFHSVCSFIWSHYSNKMPALHCQAAAAAAKCNNTLNFGRQDRSNERQISVISLSSEQLTQFLSSRFDRVQRAYLVGWLVGNVM